MLCQLQARADRAIDFFQRQKHNYRVGVVRSSVSNFLGGLTSQYNGIYAVNLGADAVQLGSLSSIGSALSALIATPIGWLVDRRGVRPFFLTAIALSASSALLYALAHDWRFLIAAAILGSVSMRLIGTSSSVICADSVHNHDRVTAQNLCSTLSAVASMVSPLIAAHLVTASGGMDIEGIRPLYYVRFAGYGLVFLLVAAKLREPREKHQTRDRASPGIVVAFRQLLANRPMLWRWIAISALTSMPMAMF